MKCRRCEQRVQHLWRAVRALLPPRWGLAVKIPEGADWCEKCSEFFLPILGVRGCPFCTPAPRPQDVGRKR